MWVTDCIERRASTGFTFDNPYKPQRGRRVDAANETCSTLAECTELTDCKRNVKELREENQKLQAVINDVMEVNRRWQRHHSERELHVQKLLNTIAELRAAPPSTSSESPAKDLRSGGTERLAQLEAENARLRLDVEAARRRQQALERQHREHTELLEIQVRSYKDDWEVERREKQTAEERSKDLQRQVDALTAKVTELQVSSGRHISGSSSEPIMASSSVRSSSPSSTTFRTSLHLPSLSQRKLIEGQLPKNIAHESPEPHKSSSVEKKPITIGFEGGLASVQSFNVPDYSKKLSVMEIAAPPVTAGVFKDWDKHNEEEEGTLTQTNDNVACPRCGRVFPPDKHLQFLDHFDECHEYGTKNCASDK